MCTRSAIDMVVYSSIYNQNTVLYSMLVNYAIMPRPFAATCLEMVWYIFKANVQREVKEMVIKEKFP